MKIAPLAEVKAKLSAFVASSESDGPVVITRNGKAVAVLIAPKDEEDLENLVLLRSPRFLARIERARRSLREGEGLTEAELWKVVGQADATQEAARPGNPGQRSGPAAR